jgi:fibronectin-binding autotransporter adhesin
VNATGSARLELSGGISTNAAENITISGTGNFRGALNSFSGNNTWQGNVTIGAAGTRIGAEDGATLQVSGVIDSGTANTGVISRAGSGGGVILSGVNTYLGETQVLVGRLQIAGGDDRLPVGTTLTLGSSGSNADGEFDLNSRNQEVAGLSIGTGGDVLKNSVNNSSATQSTFTVNTAAAASTFGGILKGNLALTKSGVNSLTLTGTSNTYTGATAVNQGTLRMNGSTSTSSAFTVAADATLAGNGTVGGTVNVTGILAPGNAVDAIGQLNTGSVTWNGGTGTGNQFQFNLGAASGSSDKLMINGDFTKAGDTSYVFNFMSSTPNTFGNVYTLAEWSGTTDFLAANFSFAPESLTGSFNTGSFSITDNKLQFTAVPEASNLLIGGLVGLGMMSRRRKQA